MPTVDIPGVGLVEFPEDYTGERLNTAAKGVYLRGQQLSARAEGEQPASSKGLDALSRLPAGVQSGTGRTLAGAVRAVDIAATPTFIPFMGGLGPGAETINRLNQQMPAVREEFVRGRPQRLAESTAFQLGREIEQAAAPTFGVDPARDNEFLAQLATAAGEMVPTLAAGAVAGPAGVAFQYGTSAGEAQAQEAIAAGKPEAADIAFLSAAGLGGITEAALGVPGRLLAIANRARKAGVNPGTFGRWANRNPMAAGIARAGAEGALREGAQEGLEQAGQNLIASDVAGYAPDRPVTEGVGRSAALGAILGGLVGGSAAGLNQAQRNQLAAEVRAARGQRIVGYTSEGQPIPAADAVPDPLADLRGLVPSPADAPATPGTTVLPDGRVVVVNAETGGTAFPAVSPATPPTAAAPAPTAEVAPPALSAPPAPTLNPTPNPAPISSSLTLEPVADVPDVPGVPSPLEGQPYDTALRTRPEATMETRPAAPLGLQREPTVSPELADTIQALRQGYQQQLDVPAAPQNVYVKPEAAKDIQPGQDNMPIHRQNLRDKTGVMRDWIIKRREADERTAAPHVKDWSQYFDRFVKLYADRPFPETLEQFAAKYAEDFGGARLAQDFTKDQLDQVRQLLVRQSDLWVLGQPNNDAVKQNMKNPLYGGLSATLGNVLAARERQAAPTAPAPKTPPDQSGGPTELTPPAKGTAEPLSPAEVSEFNALEQARRAGTLDAAGATRYRELETRAGQGDLLMPAPPPLTPANVPTAAKVTPAQASQAANPKTEFNAKVAKEQKKFLLDAVDKALAEAPDTSPQEIQALWRASEHFAAKQKLEDYTKANPYPTAPNRYNFGYTDEELAKYQAAQEEFQKAQQEWQARRDAELQAVAEPYLAEMIGGADVNAALTEGTELAFYRSLPHVTIEVPGDGVFSIINTKDAIREFKERAAKFPTTAARAKAPTQARTGPSPVPALGELTKDNVLKAAALAMSTDPSRAIINTVWSDGQQTVATDGRRMHWFAKGIGGTVKKPAIVDAKGKPVTNLDRDYPNWQQVRPDKAEMEVVFTGQDAGKLWIVLKQAQQMVEEKNNSIMLWWNRDRTLGISSASPDAGTYEHNVQPKAKIMTALDPQYVMDALAAARGTGSERVDILWNDDMSPVVIQAPGFEAVIMPMRLSGPSPIFDPERLTRYDLAATPETRRAMMKKDLAAIRRLGRPTGTEEVKAKWLKEQLGEVEDFAAEIARLEAKRKKEAAKPRTTAQKAAAQQRINAELQAEIDRLKALQNASSPGGVSTGTEGAKFTASAAYPGGALGTSAAPQPPPPTGTVPPAQDREHSVFPLELPELVRLARMLGQGHFPKLKEALRGGKALGVFRYREGQPDSGRIELVRGLWQMVLPEEKAELQRKAEAYANAMVDETDPAERARVAKAKYEADLEALMDERLKRDPILAVKVLAHEIGHWIDFLPQAMIHGRGNLFGHVASLKKFLRHTITWDPKFAELNETGELTEADRRRLREAARRELEKELGPIREIIEKVLIEEPVFATTGVTPEDVKRLFGMDARETMPELYLWFAGLDAATKKEVVKAAMRGMVDARVPASRIQTGTRTVEREVRKVSGRMPTPEEIAARFQAKLREAMEARRMMDINEVKAQLRKAITWWRGAPQFEEYFASPEEMYAEAFSIFLANPAALAQRAPKYFNALLNYMDRKPEAAKAYGDLQLAIRQGTLQQQRDKDLLAGFAKDEQRFRDRANDRKPPMDWVDNIVYHMDRRLGPIYRRARGSKLEGTIRGALGDFNYRAAEHERFLSAINREVSEPLVAANLEWADLGYYMFHKRVVEHFDQKAVPLGYSPHSSQKALDAKQAELGPARWAALKAAQRRFMALYQSQVVPLLKTSGLTTPELQELIEDRVFYATFKAVKDDPKDDIERLLAQSYGNGVGSHIYRRVGNVGEVANPATATLMKALSLMSAAYRNNAKRHLPAMLEEMGLPVREVEKTWDKNLNALTYDMSPMGAGSPVQKLVFLENGKPKAYYVETSIAEAFNAGDPIENNLLLGVLAASRGMKRLFTDINYGFWPFAFVRDVAGFGMQMPGLLAPVRYFKNLPKAFGASRDSLKGKPNPLADEALKRKMWIAQADPYGVRDAAENEAELQIAAHGLTPASWEKGGYKAKLAAAWEWYRNWGKVLERTHKLNGMLYLDQHYPELPEWQKQEMVREWAGSPDFLQQPGDRRWINALALFYNPWKESLRSVAKAAKHHPGEFAAKATIGIVMPTVLQSLAVMGLLGDDLEEMYKSVGDYDLTNYLVFPLGWEDKAQGKVKYLRFPLWEPARMAHGLLFGQITGRGEKPLSHAGGQVPGLNPLLTATAAWMDYKLRGRNPYDLHYGREILDPDVFKVGGTPADAAMLKWTWNQLGGSVLFRFDTRPELIKNDTPLEKSLKAPGVSNLVGRFLRVSNRGILDADRKVIEPGEQQRARVRLAVDEIKAKLLRREELGQSEHLLLSVDPYARDYLLRTLPEDYLKQQSLLFQRLQRAPNNEAKIKLLTQ